MNVFSALTKCASIAFVVGFLASNSPDHFRNSLLPLAGLMVFISVILVLFELANRGAASTVPAKAV